MVNAIKEFTKGVKGFKKKKDPYAEDRARAEASNIAFPSTTSKPATIEPPTQTKPTTFRSDKTGAVSGVSLPDGRTFLGLNPAEVQKIVTANEQKLAGTAGAVEQSQVGKTQENIALAQQVGKVGQPMPTDTTNLIEGLGGALPVGLTGGAIAGAGALGSGGAAALGVSGAATGGASLLVAGAIALASYNKLKKNLNEGIAAEYTTLPKNQRNLRAAINDVNSGGDPAQALMIFNQQLSAIDQSNADIFAQTQTNLNKFLGVEGQVELYNYELFNAQGGARDQLVREMQQALLNPDPTKIRYDLSDFQE